ncbi:cytoplasmic dynein 2 light intermediate chain 1 [Ctenocephalides felis]|uniref:cytoplasmic dynein 2 light intermediate chain 1 n=1 Tax=Ctenocephalides felis TaxID=7515 RepID=UPI000E6E344D|nr:cytoplasmic dynein 2 light intermediate chain 1 [Ctenocephalides felis]
MDAGYESLRDIAIKIVKDHQDTESNKGPNERSIFILGSKCCGKTTLLNQFLEKTEAIRPTLALDYSFMRKTSHAGQNMRRQVCHIWELGGASRTSSETLVKVPFMASSKQTVIPTTIVLMLDMSKPKSIWSDMEETIASLKLALSIEVSKGSKEVYGLYQNRIENPLPEDHPDVGSINPFPVPLLVIGGKYDIFQDYEPEIKKRICKTLRSCCHLLGATLLFYSQFDSNFIKRAKQILNDAAFGRLNDAQVKGLSTDYNKPLFVVAGSDSWSSIGTEPLTLSAISVAHSQWFPSESFKAVTIEDPAADPAFREDELDAARSHATHKTVIDFR